MPTSNSELMQALQRNGGHAQAPVVVRIGNKQYTIRAVSVQPGTYPAVTIIDLDEHPINVDIEPLHIGQQVEYWDGKNIQFEGTLIGETEYDAVIRVYPQYQGRREVSGKHVTVEPEQTARKDWVFAQGTVRVLKHPDFEYCIHHELYFKFGTHAAHDDISFDEANEPS